MHLLPVLLFCLRIATMHCISGQREYIHLSFTRIYVVCKVSHSKGKYIATLVLYFVSPRACLRGPTLSDWTWGVLVRGPFHFARACTQPVAAAGSYANVQKRGRGGVDAQQAPGGDTDAKVR
jgi:hypothetical protein